MFFAIIEPIVVTKHKTTMLELVMFCSFYNFRKPEKRFFGNIKPLEHEQVLLNQKYDLKKY